MLATYGSIGDIAADPVAWDALQKLVNLHQRGDNPKEYGFTLSEDYWTLESLLDSLDKLNEIEPAKGEDNDYKPGKPPLMSSGDVVADMLADLSSVYGATEAIALSERVSTQRLYKIVQRHNELSKPVEQRQKEYLEKAHAKWIEDNPDLFSGSFDNFIV